MSLYVFDTDTLSLYQHGHLAVPTLTPWHSRHLRTRKHKPSMHLDG